MINHIPYGTLRRKHGVSERRLAQSAGISRKTLREVEAAQGNPTVGSFDLALKPLDRTLMLLALPDNATRSDYSTVAVSMRVIQDGSDSWKIHFFELVDEFRKSIDIQLLLLSPVRDLAERLRALLASITLQLCEDVEIEAPGWALQRHFLKTPWFVSEMQSLKATAIQESPLAFRGNNIFVQRNFLARA